MTSDESADVSGEMAAEGRGGPHYGTAWHGTRAGRHWPLPRASLQQHSHTTRGALTRGRVHHRCASAVTSSFQ